MSPPSLPKEKPTDAKKAKKDENGTAPEAEDAGDEEADDEEIEGEDEEYGDEGGKELKSKINCTIFTQKFLIQN